MPLPPDHARQTLALRRLSARERWLVRIMAAITAVIVVGVVIAIAFAGGPSSRGGCVHAIFPGPIGAEQVNQCGSAARSTCATLRSSGQYGPEAVRTIAAECRRAGLPVDA